jgi:NADH:ubiquinone oxidoreductase subunit 6 (subunit J)
MSASDLIVNVLFYLFAAGAVGGALAVALSRNIVRSAFALLAVLASAGALYGLMKADFIAAAQLLIYVGGILVLIIFAVMLTHRITDVNVSNDSAGGPGATLACACLLLALVSVILIHARPLWKRDAEPFGAQAELVSGGGVVDFTLRQYQADGRTGLERGGSTLEERVVLVVKPEKPHPEALEVQVEAVAVRLEPKPRHETAPKGPPETGIVPVPDRQPLGLSRPIGQEGQTRFEMEGLPVGPVGWRVRLVGAEGPVTKWTLLGLYFSVEKGITKPAARALMGPYLFAFEAVSVLLLAALVGAAYLARKEVRE